MYSTKKDGAPVTIYVPVDCKNKCVFCSEKQLYEDQSDFNINKIIKSMEKMNTLTQNCDFIISGGEPLNNIIGTLERILMKIDLMNLQGARHKVYINTTLPIRQKGDIYILNKWRKVITCINVSRQVNPYMIESNDILLSYLRVPVRVVCVLYKLEDAMYAYELRDRFENYTIQFRDNFENVEFLNLYNMQSNEIFIQLLKTFNVSMNENEFKYNSFSWTYPLNEKIEFYRTMRHTKIEWINIVDSSGKPFSNVTEINNIIITPQGDILDDWEGGLLDLAQYKERNK